jgi:cytochrome c peroxidase
METGRRRRSSWGVTFALAGAFGILFGVPWLFAGPVEQAGGMDQLKASYRRPSAIPFPEDNQHTRERELLGRTLFFDPRLSASGIMSCATCHNPALSWGDGLPRAVGHGMSGSPAGPRRS